MGLPNVMTVEIHPVLRAIWKQHIDEDTFSIGLCHHTSPLRCARLLRARLRLLSRSSAGREVGGAGGRPRPPANTAGNGAGRPVGPLLPVCNGFPFVM